jgi:hypothetical protein
MQRCQRLTPVEALTAMDDSAERAAVADVLIYLPEKEFDTSS